MVSPALSKFILFSCCLAAFFLLREPPNRSLFSKESEDQLRARRLKGGCRYIDWKKATICEVKPKVAAPKLQPVDTLTSVVSVTAVSNTTRRPQVKRASRLSLVGKRHTIPPGSLILSGLVIGLLPHDENSDNDSALEGSSEDAHGQSGPMVRTDPSDETRGSPLLTKLLRSRPPETRVLKREPGHNPQKETSRWAESVLLFRAAERKSRCLPCCAGADAADVCQP